MKRLEATNTFRGGMILDLDPITTPNDIVTNCLNGTLVTFNGDELVMQNDMGNGRVETAFLPEGYIPLGTCSFGGIIYIVSYNPDKNLSQIGCFPSPERNITSDEIDRDPDYSISNEDFVYSKEDGLKYIKTALKKVLLVPNITFSPGDKYKIYFGDERCTANAGTITDYGNITHKIGNDPKYLRIHVVSVSEDSITYLDDTLKWFTIESNGSLNPASDNEEAYFIALYAQTILDSSELIVNLDQYRTLVTTPYNIFKSKSNGKLALFFELETIDTFSVNYEVSEIKKIQKTIEPNKTQEELYYKVDLTFEWEAQNKKRPKYVFVPKNSDYEFFYGFDSNNIPTAWNYLYLFFNPHKLNLYKYYYFEIPPYNRGEQPIEEGSHTVSVWVKPSKNICNFTFIPSMPFGLIEYLSASFLIDFSLIGKGIINVPTWRYFSNTSIENVSGSLLLQFESLVYLEPNKEIEELKLLFIPFYVDYETSENQFSPSKLTDLSDDDLKKNYDIATYKFDKKKSYSGVFTCSIPYESYDPNLIGTLHENCFYVVALHYVINNNNDILKYKLAYTCPIFNTAYSRKESKDFTELKLYEYLKAIPKISMTNLIKITYPENQLVDLETDTSIVENKEYIHTYSISIDGSNVVVNVVPDLDNKYDMFSLDGNSYAIKNLRLNDSNDDSIELTTENKGLIAYNNLNLFLGQTLQNKLDNETLGNITVIKRLLYGDDKSFLIDLSGNLNKYTLYSVNKEYPITINSPLRPIIYDQPSLENYGLIENGVDSNGDINFCFELTGIMCYEDEAGKRAGIVSGTASFLKEGNDSSGHYVLKNWDYGSSGNSDNKSTYYIGSNSHKSKEDDPVPKNISVSSGKKNIGLDTAISGVGNGVGYPIVAFIYAGYGDGDQSMKGITMNDVSMLSNGDTARIYLYEGIKGASEIPYSLYMQNNKGDYIPINQAGYLTDTKNSETKQNTTFGEELNKDIIGLLAQLYYASNDPININTTKTEGIIYLNPYVVSINVPCKVDLEVTSDASVFLDNVFSKSEKKSLLQIQTLVSNFDENLSKTNIAIMHNIKIIDNNKEEQTISKGLVTNDNVITISYGAYLDDTQWITNLLNRMNPSVESAIIPSNGTGVKIISETCNPDLLYYYVDNGSSYYVRRLDNRFDPKKGTLTKLGEGENLYYIYAINAGAESISDKSYNLAKHLGIKDERLYLKSQSSAGSITLAVRSHDGSRVGYIKRVPDISLVKSLRKEKI